MKSIVIEKSKFSSIFGKLLEKYAYEYIFMESTETFEEFKQSRRYEMIKSFRNDIIKLEDDLKNS